MSQEIDIEKAIEEAELNQLTPDQLLEFSIFILKKHKEARSDKEIQILMKYTQEVEFFKTTILQQENPEALHAELCRNLEYEYIDANQILFEAGSVGTTFYIILKGTVEVMINIATKDALGTDKFIQKKVGELSQGKAFGELAIMDESVKPRKATIVSKEDCHFATLSRSAFRSTLGHIRKEHEALLEFFTKNPVFSINHWTNRAIQQFMKSFEQLNNLNRGTILYKEGDPCDKIYMVRRGEVVVTKTIEIERNLTLNQSLIVDEKNQMYQIAREPILKNVEICFFGEGNLFGEEEALLSYKEELFLERERERLRKEFKKLFDQQRLKKAKEGFNYKPDPNINLPYDPKEDPKAIEEHVEREIKKAITKPVVRETTVMISSHKADIWVMSKKMFFTQIVGNHMAYKTLHAVIEQKQMRRYERLASIQRHAQTNIDFVAKQTISFTMLNKDILSMLKKKKIEKKEDIATVIGKADKAYSSVVNALNFIQENRLLSTQSNSTAQPTGPEKEESFAEMFRKTEILKRKSTLLGKVDERLLKLLNKVGKKAESTKPSPRDALKPVVDQSPERLDKSVIRKRFETEQKQPKLVFPPVRFPSKRDPLRRKEGINSVSPSPNRSLNSSMIDFENIRNKPWNPREMPAPPPKKTIIGEKSNRMKNLNISADIGKKSRVLLIDNPFRGLNYANNLDHHERTCIEKTLNTSAKITTRKLGEEILNPEVYFDKRISTMQKVKSKLPNGGEVIKNDFKNPLFSIEELKQSQEDIMRELTDLFKPGTMKMPQSVTHKNHGDRSARGNKSPIRNSARSPSVRSFGKDRSQITFGDIPDSARRSITGTERGRSYSQSYSRDNTNILSVSPSFLLPKESTSHRDIDARRGSNFSLFSPRRGQTPITTHREISIRDDNIETYRQAANKYPRATAILKNIIHGTSIPPPDDRIDTKALNLKINRPFVSQVITTEMSAREEATHRNNKSLNISAVSSQADLTNDQSNKIAQMIVNGRNEPKSVIHQVPKFVSHLRSLSYRENSVYNRGAAVDKAKILTNRVRKLPPVRGQEDFLLSGRVLTTNER